MKILTRYILREFCVPLFYCLTGFLSIYLLFELFGSFSRLWAAKPGFKAAVTYLAGYLAPYVQWMVPACLMLATLYTMWRFCRHSEIIAMRASGIGFFTIVKPILFMATLMACAVAWVNEYYMPAYSTWSEQFKSRRFEAAAVNEMAQINRIENAQAGYVWNRGKFPRFSDATTLEDVDIRFWDPNSPAADRNKGDRLLISERAVYDGGKWYFYSPKMFRNEGGEFVPVAVKGDLVCFPELTEHPDTMLLNNDKYKEKYMSTKDRFAFLESHPKLELDRRRREVYEAWAQLASPLACIIITLFAIPMGIATGRQSVFKGILGALGMFFAFYALTILCRVMAGRGLLTPIPAVILPDLVFLAIGAHLFWRNR